MSDETELDNQQTKIAQRRQMAVDALLESSHLRDALTDEQAAVLLDWGMAQMEAGAAATAVLSDAEADAAMEKWITAVFAVMKGVNRLTPKLAVLDQEEAEYQMDKLLTNLQQLIPSVPTNLALELLLPARNQLDNSETFRRLMAMIVPPAPPTKSIDVASEEPAPSPLTPASLEEEE